MVDDNRIPLRNKNEPKEMMVRFRTLGCYPLTGAILSNAKTLEEIAEETLNIKTSERFGRLIDKDNKSTMEDKKRKDIFKLIS